MKAFSEISPIVVLALTGFVSIGFTEAIIKPIATKFVRKSIFFYAPIFCEIADRLIPGVFGEYTGAEIDAIIRKELSDETGKSWDDVDLSPYWSVYDVRINADKAYGKK